MWTLKIWEIGNGKPIAHFGKCELCCHYCCYFCSSSTIKKNTVFIKITLCRRDIFYASDFFNTFTWWQKTLDKIEHSSIFSNEYSDVIFLLRYVKITVENIDSSKDKLCLKLMILLIKLQMKIIVKMANRKEMQRKLFKRLKKNKCGQRK